MDCECEDGEEPSGSTLINRVYDLEYDEDDRLWKVIDPEEHSVRPEVVILYDEDGRIASIEDKDSDAFEYTYHSASGAVDTVTDPDTLSTPYVQSFAYTCPTDPRRTTYTDRRGNDWLYDWSTTGTLSKFTNPLSDEQEFTFDMARNLTVYKDGLDNTWTFTYDSKGNLLKTFTPLMPNSGQNPTPKTERTYDSLNNLTSITDGEGNTVTLDYDLGAYPTLPTLITLPPDGEGNPALEIELTYYDDESDANGELFEVWMREVREDHDILLAHFEYDDWGQLEYYAEGVANDSCPICRGFWHALSHKPDSSSRLIGTNAPNGDGSANSYSLAGNHPTLSSCVVWLESPPASNTPSGFPDVPCESTGVYWPGGGWDASGADDYTRMGLLKNLEANVGGTRTYEFTYDALGRALSSDITSDSESGAASFARAFTYDPEDADNGEIERTGPDGVTTTVVLDDAGRVASMTRDGVTAAYTYDDRGLVTEVTLGNGAVIEYEYDDDQRLIRVEHFDDSAATILKLEYAYNDRDLPVTLTESDAGGMFAEVTFTYDNRGRLIAENRSVSSGPSPEYDLEYVYDQAGNRLMKIDAINELETAYVYDIDDPEAFASGNNMLQYTTVWDVGGQSSVLVSTTWYDYGDDALGQSDRNGNPTRIVTEAAADPGVFSATHFVGMHSATHFVYDKAQRVWLMMGEAWEADGPDEGDCVDGYAITWAREFRYDAARARYLNRALDPEALIEGDTVALSEVWTDYDADSSYGDFELDGNPPEPADLRSYEPGLALKDPWDESSGIEYYHADLIGTTRGTTDHLGAPAIGASGSPVTYTAFGERLDSDDHLRYGYAGSWGYQAHDVPNGDPVPYLHVGWRYYDPSTGRFLQRDPMGIGGGWNVYEYVGGRPTMHTDSLGLLSDDGSHTKRGGFPEAYFEFTVKPLHHQVDKLLALFGYPCAFVGDVVTTVFGVPFYAPNQYSIGDITAQYHVSVMPIFSPGIYTPKSPPPRTPKPEPPHQPSPNDWPDWMKQREFCRRWNYCPQ